MQKKLYIIKTLPHLIQLFLPKDKATLYAQNYSQEIERFFEESLILKESEITFKAIVNIINKAEFNKEEGVYKKGDFSIRGDIVSIWPIGYTHPIRMEFFGDELEKMYLFDESYGRKVKDVNQVILSTFIPPEKSDIDLITISLPDIESNDYNRFIFVNSISNFNENDFNIVNTDFQYPQLFYSRFDIFEKELQRLKALGYSILVKSRNIEHLPDELVDYAHKDSFKLKPSQDYASTIKDNIFDTEIPAGFISNELNAAVFTDRELFGSIYLTRPERTKNISSNIKKLLRQFEGNIEIGDYVVHEDYGIAIYAGLQQEEIDGQMMEYLLLKYAKEDELLVPIHQVEKITKYIGPDNVVPRITRLGKASWEVLKAKVKKSAGLLASKLVEHYAKREISKAQPISKEDSDQYQKFVNEFKYTETDDQLRATNEIISDLEKDKPMNRLLVGDVGFGKTEVFMRAAFKVVENGGQVAVLAPTTILTAQHYTVFKDRFMNHSITIAYLSRFNTNKQNKEIIDKANEGKIDIIIGTHRILSNDLKFKNLQLVIVDEEQKFGVKQKEKIKQVNYAVHVLSVSATPIPRTLSMALASIQEISIITQPPKNRKPIHTEIIKDNWNKAADAISFEMQRGRQVYFMHNEVQSIQAIKAKLEHLLPGIRFIVAHGQMAAAELDRIMTEFYDKKYDCLICTTIIENGLDVPNVNTIVINKAHRFGLAQLYQLRGRVGRSDKQSFCYLLYEGRDLRVFVEEQAHDELKAVDNTRAKKLPVKKYIERLQALVDNQDLGSGFRIASRDLEIRGAGNLLGDQQSGHISTIGYALYIEMLAQQVEKIRAHGEALLKPVI